MRCCPIWRHERGSGKASEDQSRLSASVLAGPTPGLLLPRSRVAVRPQSPPPFVSARLHAPKKRGPKNRAVPRTRGRDEDRIADGAMEKEPDQRGWLRRPQNRSERMIEMIRLFSRPRLVKMGEPSSEPIRVSRVCFITNSRADVHSCVGQTGALRRRDRWKLRENPPFQPNVGQPELD